MCRTSASAISIPNSSTCSSGRRLAGNAVLQRLPIEKLHGNEGLVVVVADFMDGTTFWMVQG